ncbi:MAG: hypothetical protein H7326_07700 [Bdellovibrionaceae bacterium]|nr:hypothetical protein [Pseudobdellovibrionaceae bacterium]
MGDWEEFLYELKRYAYVAIGVYALSVEHPNPILIAFALVLLLCGIAVLRMGFESRPNANLESLFYESLPFIYLGLGGYALLFLVASKFGVACGLTLLFCATKVLRWRMKSRG